MHKESQIYVLRKIIELLRAELVALAEDCETFNSPELVKKSQELDEVLLAYYKLLEGEQGEE